MPVFNCERFVGEAIESILAQAFQHFELLAIDDGSDDGSREIVSQFARSDPRVRLLVNDRNLGLGTTLNAAWHEARGPYIARLDADDIALPGRLGKQVSFLDAHPDVAAVGGALIRIDQRGARGATMTFPTSDRGIRATLARRSCIAHSAALIRREALERVGGYRLNEAEDFDLWLRLSQDWKLANLAEPVLLYRQHPSQATVATFERQAAATLAVRASAKARRSGRPDPIAFSPVLNKDPLARVELEATDVADRVTHDCLELAASYELLGHHDASRTLLAHVRTALGPSTDRTFAAALALKRADAHLSARRPDNALVSAGAAVLRAPVYSSRRMASRLRDRFHGRRFR
jgi:hypothetical protein